MNHNILYFGSATEPPHFRRLKTGPLNLDYENGFLRHINLGSVEIINMIYFALRDHNWNTFHGTIKNEKIKETKKGFEISYRSVISVGTIQYVFDCLIKASSDGKLEFGFRGESFSNFRSNRIGFCVLHSITYHAGKSCMIHSTDKSEIIGTFPVNAEPHQPFLNIKSMRWEPTKGWEAEIKFDGDIFETEDQRNWSDGTFKTYCTPVSKPFPVEVRMGDSIKQKVTLNLTSLRKDSVSKIKEYPALSLTVARGGPTAKLPLIGFGDTSSYKDYSESDVNLLSALGFQHLRCEVDLNEHGLSDRLQKLKAKSVKLRVPLMIALIFGNNPDLQVREFIETAQKENPEIDSIILFSNSTVATTADLLSRVLEPLRKAFPSVKIGGGTNQYFAELNRNRVDAQFIDFLSFTSSPASHLTDNTTIVENLEGSAGAVKTALLFSGGKPVYVSPVSLRVPSKLKTTEMERSFGDQLPPDVDARQSSLFAAAWTLGSVKHLAEAGAGQVTYYETTGWKGIIQGSSPSPLPSVFYSQAGVSFPMYFVFHWLGKLVGAGVIPVTSTNFNLLSGLALEKDGGKYLMLANHSMETLEFPINNFKNALIVARLNEKNTISFMDDPIAFFDKGKEEPVENIFRMMPFELMVLKSQR